MDKFGEVGSKAQTVVWRIENFEPVRVDEAQHGTLYSGDSYLVLHSTESSSGKLSHDIYFWLGSETSQDESTSAATHAVLLDDVLGGSAVQHREVCGEESAGFLKVFKSLKVLKGGKGTALRHVGAGQYDPRLVHIKLARGLLVAEVPLAAASLNSGDSFILDTATAVFLWHGPEASPREKSKALDVAVGIRDEDHAGSAELVVVEGEDVASADALAFYEALGVADPASVTLQPPVADADAAAALEPPRLFTAASGAFIELEEKPLRRGLLASDGTFFLVAAGSVWVWTGKATPPDARAAASELGSEFVQLQGLPSNTTVKVTKENLEPALFKLHFRDWPQDELLQYVRHAKAPQEAAPQDVAALAASMLTAPPSEEEKAMFAEGGTTQVWLVAAGSGDLQELPSQQASQLHDAECYIVQYTYPVAGGSTAAVIYYWLGRNSSTQEQATAAMVANRLHQTDFKGRSTLVRVAQGAEPSHFHRAFPAPLIIHDGDAAGAASGGGARLYHVKGDTAREAVAVEVEPVAASLNSGDCFVLVGAGGASCCWVGKHSTEAEIEAAIEVATALGAEDAIVEEGDEEDVFWEALGGKAEYAVFGTIGAPKLVPRLFQVNAAGAGGRVAVTPIPAFSQDDLSDGDVMLLDTYNEVFVWVGTTASAAEQTAAADLAQQYVTAAAASDGRSPATAITRVQAGAEPPLFTCHFAGWDATKRPVFVDPYEAKLAALKQQQAAVKDAEPAAARGLPEQEEEEEEAAGGHANGSSHVKDAADDDIEDDIEDAEPASPMTDIEDAEPASPMTEDDDENQLSNPFAAGSPAKAAAAAAKQAEQQQQQQQEEEEEEEETQEEAQEETQEETQEQEQEADAPPMVSSPVAEPLAGASLLEAAAAKLDSLGSPAPAAASPAPAAAAPAAAADDGDDVPQADSPAAVASPAPVATTTADGAAAAEEEAAGPDTPATPAAPSPKVSVAEMARLAAVRDASVEPPPVPKPVSTEPRSWANGTKVLVSEGSGSAPTTPVKPVVLTAHDTKNTANVAQILSAGSFEKVPLQDFLPYSELVGMRLEDGIDVSRKEDYLSEEEFVTVFGFTRDEFQKMPAWRKIQTKKKHMLF